MCLNWALEKCEQKFWFKELFYNIFLYFCPVIICDSERIKV